MDEQPSKDFKKGDRVRIIDGVFKNHVGVVDIVDEAQRRVAVLVQIFGRTTPVEVEKWEVESL